MRPTNWDNPYPCDDCTLVGDKSVCNGVCLEMTQWESKEAGADAYEVGLKKQGIYGEYGEDFIISTKVKSEDPDWAESFYKNMPKKGWLVFIEEEE